MVCRTSSGWTATLGSTSSWDTGTAAQRELLEAVHLARWCKRVGCKARYGPARQVLFARLLFNCCGRNMYRTVYHGQANLAATCAGSGCTCCGMITLCTCHHGPAQQSVQPVRRPLRCARPAAMKGIVTCIIHPLSHQPCMCRAPLFL